MSPYPGKAQQPQEQRYPFPSVCAVFSCVQSVVWLPELAIFTVRADVSAYECTQAISCPTGCFKESQHLSAYIYLSLCNIFVINPETIVVLTEFIDIRHNFDVIILTSVQDNLRE